ncbi:AI-2E family transporter [Schaalia sp. lx-260]|uniref:AI-2E family transporter n=1 Tax=Schaalia sp. lx-260 TaxID=2899082 RepID=UPI001E59A5A3|nr:AI-2E family transporter [Schaalia sp. lx-260]MCD4550262.1 AI-2E family transporter [Schaalia sp. lx-260]
MVRRSQLTSGIAHAMKRIATAAASARQSQVQQMPLLTELPKTESLRDDSAEKAVPWTLRVSAALSWRLMVVSLAAIGIGYLMIQVYIIVLPIAVALLLAVLISPLVGWFHKKLHFPKALAAAVGLVVTLSVVLVTLSGAGTQIISQLPRLFRKAMEGFDAAAIWIEKLPFKIDTKLLTETQQTLQNEIGSWLKQHTELVASSALSVTSSVLSGLSSMLLVLFCLFFFLKDGRKIWIWVVRLFPEPARVPIHESAIRGWVTLGGYVRSQIQVAAIDAIGIGLGAYFLGVPMAIPIVVVVFFGSFVPILGALISGSIAVLVALVDQGPMAGLIMLIIILAVQQIEGNLLQPLIMSNAVSLHPVAVLLVVAGCGTVAGIPGAIFGVPVAAFINATFLYLHGYDPIPALATDPDRPGGPPGMLHDMIVASYSKEASAGVVHKAEDEKTAAHKDATLMGASDGDSVPKEAVARSVTSLNESAQDFGGTHMRSS